MWWLRRKLVASTPDAHEPVPTPIKKTAPVSFAPSLAAAAMLVLSAFRVGAACSASSAAVLLTLEDSAMVRQKPVTAGASGASEGAPEGGDFVRLATSATMAPMMPMSAHRPSVVRAHVVRLPRAGARCAAGCSPSPPACSGAQQGVRCSSSEAPMGEVAALWCRSMSAGAGVRGGAPAGVCGENTPGAGAPCSGLSGNGPADMFAPLRA